MGAGRPRYPLPFTLYEGRYPEDDQASLTEAMETMDQGYLAQDYYRKAGVMVELEGKSEETHHFGNYSWTEHMGRKWGQWLGDPQAVRDQLRACGFDLTGEAEQMRGEEQHHS